MKKLFSLALVALFVFGVLAPSQAFACAGEVEAHEEVAEI